MELKIGKYLHYKGNYYDVLGIAKHSETLEDMVIYEALYKNELSQLWARPYELFIADKEKDGKKVKAFTYVGPLKHPKIEVHVGTFCFYKGKVIILKRTNDRRLYPGLWECGGGKVRPGETFEDAVKRQVLEEMGAEVKIIKVIGTYNIPTPDSPQKVIPGVKFLCEIVKFKNGKEPSIGDEHTEWKLIGKEEVDKFEFIKGIKKELKDLF